MTHYNLSFRIGQYRFSSGIYFTLFTCFAITLCLVLSVWQSHRGLSANTRFLLQQEKNKYPSVILPKDPQEYQKVTVQGDVAGFYLLDNRSSNRQPGREVLVDIKLNIEGSPYDRALVNVGWQPRTDSLEPAHKIPGFISIEGMTKVPAEGFILQDPLLDPLWPSLLQQVDFALLDREQGHEYYPAVIYTLTPVSDWPLPVVQFKNKYHMHLGYAMQWALIGVACLLLFIKISTSRAKDENQQKLAT